MAALLDMHIDHYPSMDKRSISLDSVCDRSSTDSGVQEDEARDEQTIDGSIPNPTSSEDSGTSSCSNSSNDSEKPLLKPSSYTSINEGRTAKQANETNDGSEQPLANLKNQEELEFGPRDCNSSCDKLFWKKILVIFFVLDVLLIATILVVLLGIPSRHGSDHPSTLSEHCLNCSDVYLTQDDMSDNIYNFTQRDGGQCCSNNQTHLIQKYVLKRYRADLAKDSSRADFPTRTALHVELDLKDSNSINAGTNQTLRWMRDDALVSANLTLSQDGSSVQIGRTGLYFVSPMIVFSDTKGDEGGPDLDPMLLQVYRVRGAGELLLLEGKETHCANSESTCNIPSSAQGVFMFEKGDDIVVKVTKPCGLVLKEKLNHFDIYLI